MVNIGIIGTGVGIRTYVLVVAEAIATKYIVLTDIAMVYGILERDN